MALISLNNGTTFSANILKFNWNHKFLILNRDPFVEIIRWDNIKSISLSKKEYIKNID